MKAQFSPLALIDFAIINSNFKFIPSSDEINIREVSAVYDIDIDFAIIQELDSTRVFIKTAINNVEEQKPGYAIFAEGVGVFQLTADDKLTEEDKKSLLQYSAVSIALNSLRGFISSLTANAPFGRYILPSIDVNKLFHQKIQVANQVKPKRKKK